MTRTLATVVLLFSLSATAADLGPDLLEAAKKGQTARVESLAAKGASIESQDKDGRTPLMLAAQHGHSATVRALLATGAKADRRDKLGWTAYGLALFSTSSGREEVLKALPAPGAVRLAVKAVLGTEDLFNSCLMRLPQLVEQVKKMRPEERVVAAIRDAAEASVKGPVELAGEGGDGVLNLRVEPRVGCVPQQNGDNVGMEVDVRVVLNGAAGTVLEKTYGGGLKGMREQIVTGEAQYAPVFDEWAKKHGAAIYVAVLEAILRHGP